MHTTLFMINIFDFVGLFCMLAGFIIGLGSVTVIDIHGFLGRTSSYWSEATTRTHKVTKPLIWAGIFLLIFGGIFFYRDANLTGIPLIHLIISIVLIINGCFLSFSVSPFLLEQERQGKQKELLSTSWQHKIMASMILSDIGWWGALVLFVIYLLQH